MYQRFCRIAVLRFPLYVCLVAVLITTAFSHPVAQPRAANPPGQSPAFVSQEQHREIEDQIAEQTRRMDTLESRQIEVLTKLATVDTALHDLKDSSDHRQTTLDTIVVGIAVLIVEMVLRSLVKAKASLYTRHEKGA